jgi:hypothetical protein
MQASLTISLRRSEMTAFWLLAAVIVAVGAWMALTMTSTWARVAWAAAAGGCILIPGAFWSVWFEFGVRGWNKGVRLLTPVLRRYTLIVCYYLFFGSVSRVGSSLDVVPQRAQSSKWTPRTPSDAASRRRASKSNRAYWAEVLAATRTGRGWAIFLLPFVLLLRLLHVERRGTSPPSSTYTLY